MCSLPGSHEPELGLLMFDKVLVVVTEDWFAVSHFKPPLLELATLASEVEVATAFSGRHHELQVLGLRMHDLDLRRGSRNPLDLLRTVH